MNAFRKCMLIVLVLAAGCGEIGPAVSSLLVDPGTRSWTNEALPTVKMTSVNAVEVPAASGDRDGAGCIPTTCIPPVDVLRYSVSGLDLPAYTHSADERLAQLETWPVCKRHLALLVFAPPLWDWDGLYGFFFFEDADLAPEIAAAMGAVGLDRYRSILKDAIALFGRPYPRHAEARQARYAAMSNPNGIPTDFDVALRFLAQEFGSLSAYDHAVDAIIGQSGCMSDFVETARAGMTPYQRLFYLLGLLAREVDPSAEIIFYRQEVAELPSVYRQLYLASQPIELPRGLLDLFRGPEGSLAPEIAMALDELSLPEPSAVIREAMAVFPAPYPISTAERRRHVLGRASDLPSRRLLALDGAIDRGVIVDALLCAAEAAGILPR